MCPSSVSVIELTIMFLNEPVIPERTITMIIPRVIRKAVRKDLLLYLVRFLIDIFKIVRPEKYGGKRDI